MQPVLVSDALRRFAGGAPEISRAGAVKLIWAHIKANGLQCCSLQVPLMRDDTMHGLNA
ncbi:hypothetical protein E2562_002920 [Oryza meyeriana var. granulata]|uniref:DM2 domain-containing protein n=1 Tax=Oryza meyeriana var. granulata TaxID=110450 RepID=A0A6G1DDE3_9ORYZ|nr:hypothetical protein E2562_002920 [Oryza meyeriana var. granulata]KAF0910460.1 hypothetical protein E2562_002920 [Oryza meyeriana var. granulata]